MKYTQKIISKYFEDSDHLFMFWGEEDSMAENEQFYAMDYLALFISLQGTIELGTDMTRWEATPGKMQLFAYEKFVHVISFSPDYKSVGILLSRKYWAERLLYAYPSLSLTLMRPVIELDPEMRTVLLDFLNQIRIYKEEGRSDDNPLVVNTLMGLLNHVGKVCEKNLMKSSRGADSKVVSEFSRLLFLNYDKERSVEFYATKLNLSPSHFSSLVKKSTGMTVGHCIQHYVLLKICSELKNTTKSIKEIALDMNFTDVSYFCKFFRKNMRMSPEEFRRGRRHKNSL